jgi:hypothetical protein
MLDFPDFPHKTEEKNDNFKKEKQEAEPETFQTGPATHRGQYKGFNAVVL